MARTGKVRVDITADASGVQRGVTDAERSLSRLERSGSKALGALKVAGIATGAALGTGLAAAVATGVRELKEAEAASAQTEARLKSTGKAANVTKGEIEGLASALQRQTGVADDAIQSGQNLLLTFTNIRNEAGRGNDIFNRATRTALDLSVAFGKDLNGSAVLVGKALNDPIKGVSALTRVGVSFTDQQKDQIKTLVESNRTLDAQKLILRELNKQVGGSAVAAGNTTVGQLERVKRAWEEASQALVIKFMPIFTRVADAILRNMDKVEAVFAGIAMAANGMVKFVGALFRGDWQRAWDIAADGAGKALRAIGVLAEQVLLPLAQKAGRAIVRGIAQGFEAGIRSLPAGSVLYRILTGGVNDGGISISGSGEAALVLGAGGIPRSRTSPSSSTPLAPSRRPGFARGGEVPGQMGQAVPITAHAGEVVLNPTQQRIIGIDRIMATLARTGGVVGGSSFAVGGVVAGAMDKARSNLGEPYGKPSRGESRTGPNSWDCSGYATYVAGVNVGGTTASAYSASTAVRDHQKYPIVWGFRKSHSGGYRGGYDEHMGVRVGGVWYQTSGGQTAQTGSDGDWQEIRVPAGLGNLQGQDGDGPLGEAARGRGGASSSGPTLAQRISSLVGKTAAKALGTGAPDLSDGSAPSFTGSQNRSVAGAGRAARAKARAAGLSPDQVAKAGDDAERAAEVKVLRKQLTLAQEDLTILRQRKGKLLAAYRKLGRKKVGPANRAAKKKAMAQMRADLRAYTEEMSEVREEIAEVKERLLEIDEQVAADQYQENYESAQDAGDQASTSTATDSTSSVPTGPTADQQAAIDQANARAETATRGAAISDSFLRTLFGSGTIDPGAGSVTVNIQTLHPGDPAIQGEVARWVVGALGGQGSVPASTFRV